MYMRVCVQGGGGVIHRGKGSLDTIKYLLRKWRTNCFWLSTSLKLLTHVYTTATKLGRWPGSISLRNSVSALRANL